MTFNAGQENKQVATKKMSNLDLLQYILWIIYIYSKYLWIYISDLSALMCHKEACMPLRTLEFHPTI